MQNVLAYMVPPLCHYAFREKGTNKLVCSGPVRCKGMQEGPRRAEQVRAGAETAGRGKKWGASPSVALRPSHPVGWALWET